MALILHLETATPTCSVALSEKGRLLALKEETAANIHAGAITLFIEAVMREGGRQLSQLDAVCVSKGPGSYTGLRIGVSTAKGLCYALDKPLIAINTLEAMASGLANSSDVPPNALLCPMLDARRMEVFMGIYRALPAETPQNTPLRKMDIPAGEDPLKTNARNKAEAMPKEVQEEKAPQAMVMEERSLDPWMNGNKLLIFGTGAEKCRPLYENQPEIEILPNFRQSAVSLLLPAERKYDEKQYEDVAYFEPFYLKDFISTAAKK